MSTSKIAARVAMENLNEVESLFSVYESKWYAKYSAGGPLRSRLHAFGERLSEFVKPPAKILDLGCGTGNLAGFLTVHGYTVTACDITEKMITRAQEANAGAPIDWFLLPADWRELPFASRTFDAILASSVFEYLSDVPRVFSECHRTLRPGGILIATVPNPKNLVRKLEKIFRPMVIAMSLMPLLRRIPKLESYATYLKCSQHRVAMDQWFSLGKEAQLLPLARDGKEKQNRENNPPLVFILFRKSQ